jgi:hypothetical protein
MVVSNLEIKKSEDENKALENENKTLKELIKEIIN